MAPVAAFAAQGSICNLGQGCWRLKSTYSSAGDRNPLWIQVKEEEKKADQENEVPSQLNTQRPGGFPRLPTLQIGPASTYAIAFTCRDRPVVQRFKLIDEKHQVEGILEVTQTLAAGEAVLSLAFHGLPGQEAVINRTLEAKDDRLVIRTRNWSQGARPAKRGLALHPSAPVR